MLCLTVFESKGLEFDDVVLYNFFNSGEIQSGMWKLINDIQFTDQPEKELEDIVKGLKNLVVSETKEDTKDD